MLPIITSFLDCTAGEILPGEYRGLINVSESGKTCQKWTSQTPHSHSRTPQNYPGKGLGDHNYCRNPDGDEKGAWCYTTDPAHRWQYCACTGNDKILSRDHLWKRFS